MSKPTEKYLWAESGGTSTYPTAKQANGWTFEDPLPFDNMNAIQKHLGRWMDYVQKGNGGLCSSFTDALANGNLSDGDVVVLSPPPYLTTGDEIPCNVETAVYVIDSGVDLDVCGTNGSHFVAINNTGNRMYIWNDNDNTVTTVTGLPANVQNVAINHEVIAVASSTRLDVFELDGTVVNNVAANSAITDVCITTDTIWITDGNILYSVPYDVDLSTVGPAASEYDHTAALNACCTDGVQVFVGGASNGSGFNVVAYSILGSTDFWSVNLVVVAGPGAMCTDGSNVFVLKSGDGIYQLLNYSGVTVEYLAQGTGTMTRIACDDTHVFWNRSGVGFQRALKSALADAHFYNTTLSTFDQDPQDLCTNGHQLLVVGDAGGGSRNAATFSRQGSLKSFRYRDAPGAITNGMGQFHPLNQAST